MTIKKKNKMPKVVMAASVAVMGMGLFSTFKTRRVRQGEVNGYVVPGLIRFSAMTKRGTHGQIP